MLIIYIHIQKHNTFTHTILQIIYTTYTYIHTYDDMENRVKYNMFKNIFIHYIQRKTNEEINYIHIHTYQRGGKKYLYIYMK